MLAFVGAMAGGRMSMNKKIVIMVVGVLIAAAAGYWYWQSTREAPPSEEQALQNAEEAAQAITESATQGVLPSLDVQANPLGDSTDVNPISKTNPFSGIKTNPFE